MENVAGSIAHLRNDQTYPASKADLAAACSGLSDFSEADKKEFVDGLPDRTYNNANEVIAALGWQA